MSKPKYTPRRFYRLQEVGGLWSIYTPNGNVIVQGLNTIDSATAIKILNDWMQREDTQ